MIFGHENSYSIALIMFTLWFPSFFERNSLVKHQISWFDPLSPLFIISNFRFILLVLVSRRFVNFGLRNYQWQFNSLWNNFHWKFLKVRFYNINILCVLALILYSLLSVCYFSLMDVIFLFFSILNSFFSCFYCKI